MTEVDFEFDYEEEEKKIFSALLYCPRDQTAAIQQLVANNWPLVKFKPTKG